eukprot:6183374-Pleurochrysis_carterae.AAC.3
MTVSLIGCLHTKASDSLQFLEVAAKHARLEADARHVRAALSRWPFVLPFQTPQVIRPQLLRDGFRRYAHALMHVAVPATYALSARCSLSSPLISIPFCLDADLWQLWSGPFFPSSSHSSPLLCLYLAFAMNCTKLSHVAVPTCPSDAAGLAQSARGESRGHRRCFYS